jgi:hypothetical protein
VWKYLKAAFLNHWNLLVVAGGTALAFVSGQPDIVLPVVAASELAYLGFLGTHPKFQRAVDAQEAQRQRSQRSQRNQEVLQRIARSLPRRLLDRYDELRARCNELRQIGADLKSPDDAPVDEAFDTMQVRSLDRLLWVYLRLLFTRHSLERFLDHTSLDQITADMQRVEGHLASLDPDDQSPHAQKIRTTLNDNLQTSRERIENYRRAEANYQFVQLELDRLENKIKSLSELAVNRQDPEFISGEINQAARSMLETEKTMNELQVITGLGEVDDEAPDLLKVETIAG